MKKFLRTINLQLKNSRLSHAYLIIGPVQIEELVDVFSVKLPDLLELKDNAIKIDSIRSLGHWLQLKPHSSERKLAVIFQAESMTTESANALLKILEEPPASSILILQANRKEKILPTIVSRCQIFKTGGVKEPGSEYLKLDQLKKQPLKKRFDYVNELILGNQIEEVLNCWEQEARQEMLAGKEKILFLQHISKARDLLSTNSSVKLLLENLLLEI